MMDARPPEIALREPFGGRVCVSMPLRCLALATLIGSTMIGCQPAEPAKVYVNVEALRSELAPQRSPEIGLRGDFAPQSLRLLGERQALMVLGLSEAEIQRTLSLARERQERTLAQIFEQRRRVLEAEVQAALDAQLDEKSPEYDAVMEEAVRQTRVIFDRYASEIGRRTLALTNLIGFPDQGQDLEVVDADWSRARAQRVMTLRSELAVLQESYLEERDAVLKRATDSINADKATIRANAEQARIEGEARLRRDLEQLSKSGIPDLNNVDRGSANRVVPPSSTAQSAVRSPSSSLPPLPTNPPTKMRPEWVEAWVKLWAKQRGVSVVRTPGDAPDATEEVKRWMQQRQLGL